jgi:hypothetical protein
MPREGLADRVRAPLPRERPAPPATMALARLAAAPLLMPPPLAALLPLNHGRLDVKLHDPVRTVVHGLA